MITEFTDKILVIHNKENLFKMHQRIASKNIYSQKEIRLKMEND